MTSVLPLFIVFSASVPVPVDVCVSVWKRGKQLIECQINGQFVCFVHSGSRRCRVLFFFYIKTKSRAVGYWVNPLKKHTHTLLLPCLNLSVFASTIAVGSLVFFFFFPNRVGRILTDLFIWIRYKLSLPGRLHTLRTSWVPPFSAISQNSSRVPWWCISFSPTFFLSFLIFPYLRTTKCFYFR